MLEWEGHLALSLHLRLCDTHSAGQKRSNDSCNSITSVNVLELQHEKLKPERYKRVPQTGQNDRIK